MKNYSGLLIFLLTILNCNMAFADVNVRGYYRADGTYVHPYTRSEPHKKGQASTANKTTVEPLQKSEQPIKKKDKKKKKHKKSKKDSANAVEKQPAEAKAAKKTTKHKTRRPRSRSQALGDKAWQSKGDFINQRGRPQTRGNVIRRPKR